MLPLRSAVMPFLVTEMLAEAKPVIARNLTVPRCSTSVDEEDHVLASVFDASLSSTLLIPLTTTTSPESPCALATDDGTVVSSLHDDDLVNETSCSASGGVHVIVAFQTSTWCVSGEAPASASAL